MSTLISRSPLSSSQSPLFDLIDRHSLVLQFLDVQHWIAATRWSKAFYYFIRQYHLRRQTQAYVAPKQCILHLYESSSLVSHWANYLERQRPMADSKRRKTAVVACENDPRRANKANAFIDAYPWLVQPFAVVMLDSGVISSLYSLFSRLERLIIVINKCDPYPIPWNTIISLPRINDVAIFYPSISDNCTVDIISPPALFRTLAEPLWDPRRSAKLYARENISRSANTNNTDNRRTSLGSARNVDINDIDGSTDDKKSPNLDMELIVFTHFLSCFDYYQYSRQLRMLLSTIIVSDQFLVPEIDYSHENCWPLISQFYDIRHLCISSGGAFDLTQLNHMSQLVTLVIQTMNDMEDSHWSIPMELKELTVIACEPYGTYYNTNELFHYITFFPFLKHLSIRQLGTGFNPELLDGISRCASLRSLRLSITGNHRYDIASPDEWQQESDTWQHLRHPALTHLSIECDSPDHEASLHHLLRADTFPCLRQLELSYPQRTFDIHPLLLIAQSSHLRDSIQILTITIPSPLMGSIERQCTTGEWQMWLHGIQQWRHLHTIHIVRSSRYRSFSFTDLEQAHVDNRIREMRCTLPQTLLQVDTSGYDVDWAIVSEIIYRDLW